MPSGQADLFAPVAPQGLAYRAGIITPGEEAGLVAAIAALDLQPFAFRGFLGRRRVASFGWRYDFNSARFDRAAPLPDFLLPIRARAAGVARIDPDALEHALVTEYAPGAGIGWHRDRPVFGDVVGVSLGSACTLRLRRKRGARWERASIEAAPRSAYLLRGPARHEWEHGIAAVAALRYSVTFRALAG